MKNKLIFVLVIILFVTILLWFGKFHRTFQDISKAPSTSFLYDQLVTEENSIPTQTGKNLFKKQSHNLS